jgi:predicted  nucleic acid-binding Zn-ribbon protein
MAEHLRMTLQEITLAKLEQDRAISQQFSGNAEIGELKRELLKAQNEVDMALEREAKLQLDMEDLNKTKQDLVHDIEEIRRHKADMLEPQLIAATKELKVSYIHVDGAPAASSSN